jgi:hypothetical protein
MSYDNSELLKNYVHAYQATSSEFFAEVARDIIRWMDEWLSDREHSGFYASQDADIAMDDDGDYFTWTLQETQSVLSEEEAQVACLHYDINEVGEMHHNPAKNVLYVRASVEEICARLGLAPDQVRTLLHSAKQKMYAARLLRPTPYVDKTLYVGWNALCVSAYLEAARVLELDSARHFALRSLDRILAQGWTAGSGLVHVLAYSDEQAACPRIPGLLDDYAFTVLACLDAYEATSDLNYFKFARRIADIMIEKFNDADAGGFFDTEQSTGENRNLGVLAIRRKPFQDSPTPAGNPAAARGLLRLLAYTDDQVYLDKARQTIESFAGSAAQYRVFAATYGLAGVQLSQPHVQVVIVGDGDAAKSLLRVALKTPSTTRTTLQLPSSIAKQNLPPSLAATIPQLPAVPKGKAVALVCSGSTCEAPTSDAEELDRRLNRNDGSVP